jgi:CubicO group peptidase (beta-lactamase class C family)
MPEPIRATRRTVLKSLLLGGAGCILADHPALASPAARLPRTSPEAAGVSAEGILKFVDAVEQKPGGLNSVMLLRHGKVIAEGWWEPYGPQHPHTLYSLSKSFCSTAVGLAVAENRLSVDDKVVSFFPTDTPPKIDDNLAEMRVKHLLMMGTGHDKDATSALFTNTDGNWPKAFLSLAVEHKPASKFVYNSAATYMCSAIAQKVTGMPIVEYLAPRLFEPLGIGRPIWETCPRGVNTGGWGLNLRTEDIAKFGQLYLQKGRWSGKQLIPAAWIAEATSKQISNGDGGASDWAQGYGYQFWRCRNGAYRGDGAHGQFCVVMPGQDAVLAVTSGVGDMQAILNAAWEHLLPAMESNTGSKSESDLKRRLSRLAIAPPVGKPESPDGKKFSGRTYRFDANPQKIRSITFDFSDRRCSLTLEDEQGAHKLTASFSSWIRGEFPYPVQLPTEKSPKKVAARGAWAADDTYTLKLCFYETPYVQSMAFRFNGDKVSVKSKLNVAFGPVDRPEIVGTAA